MTKLYATSASDQVIKIDGHTFALTQHWPTCNLYWLKIGFIERVITLAPPGPVSDHLPSRHPQRDTDRRFMTGFVELTSHVTNLTQKCAPDLVQWTEQCQAVFVQVQKTLCGEPLFYTPNFPLSFILQIDALNRGLGARLFQQVRGVDRPVVYISRKLLATQCVSCPLCPLCATKMKKIQN